MNRLLEASSPRAAVRCRDRALGAGKKMSVSETGWTPELVAARLAEAADVLARLPEDRVRGFYDLWASIVGAPCRASSPAAAMPDAIDRMDEALGWLCWLDDEERRLVWLRAEGLPWKRITQRLGIGRTTAWQRWTTALLKISVRLNAVDEQKRPNNKLLNRRAGSVVERI
jgi:Domain of unknown function (DUF6362)